MGREVRADSGGDAERLAALGEGLPDGLQAGLWELVFVNLVTCGIASAVWKLKRRREILALGSPLPISLSLATADIVGPYIGAVGAQTPLAHASLFAVISGASIWAGLTYNYRFLRALRWRGERVGVRVEVGALGWVCWLCFGILYLQHKLNCLVRAERALVIELTERLAQAPARPIAGSSPTAEDPLEAGAAPKLKSKRFWALIASLDHDALARGDDVAAVASLRSTLAEAPRSLRAAFHETLAQKLYAFDGPMFAAEAGPRGGEEDRCLLARTFVVAAGQTRYREVLATPEEMPKEPWQQCSALLRIAAEATEDAGEDPLGYVPSVSVETGSNLELWRPADDEDQRPPDAQQDPAPTDASRTAGVAHRLA